MIISKDNNSWSRNSTHLDTNFSNNHDFVVIDETTETGKQMAQIYIENYPFIDIKTSGQMVVGVTITDKPVKPPEVEGKDIKLVKDETDQWAYDYVDKPLTKEQELEDRVTQLETQIQALLAK